MNNPHIGVDVRSYMTMNYEFSGIRIIEEMMIPVKWKIEIDMVSMITKPKQVISEVEKSAGETYQKLYYWLDTNLPNCIFTDIENEFGMFIANTSSNIMMYCPGSPNDDLIGTLIHAKMATVAGENLYIGSLRISADDTTATYTIGIAHEEEYGLPVSTKDIYEAEVLNEVPWWFRNDGFSFEFIKPEGVDGDIHELFKDIYDPFSDFNAHGPDFDIDLDLDEEKEPAKIIKWTPKKV